ncbi:MAG: hypothetical protein IJK89_10195 [Clostridia bacterium]|nr:hypothetical protein [Clostridia bacterium]
MKKTLFRSICILLSLVLLSAAIAPVARPVASAAGQEEGPVAEIYLCVSGIYFPYYFFGHAWICISNISGEPFTVGAVTLAPGGMMSVGLHSDAGMTYNREMSRFRGRTVSAVRQQINAEQLQNAAREITSSNWDHYLLFTHNCTHFAAAVWKAATGVRFNTAVFPFILKSQLPADQTVSLYIG